MNEKLKSVLNFRTDHQGSEFFIGNIFLIVGGVFLIRRPVLAAFAIVIGLFLDHRVFFQTLSDIDEAHNSIKQAENRIDNTRQEIKQMSDEIFGSNTNVNLFNIPDITPTVPDITAPFSNYSANNKALEDKIDANRQQISTIIERLEELESSSDD
jgi:peptidoglycan hydrolase CwlO-like protein